jgi:hypothetical protein
LFFEKAGQEAKMANNTKEIIEKAVEQARKHGRKYGLRIGIIVAHSSREDAMKLVRKEGKKGIVLIHPKFSSTGREAEMAFPLRELFDPTLALFFAKGLTLI